MGQEPPNEGADTPPRLYTLLMRRILPLIFIALVFLAGIGLVAYPMVSNTLYERNQSTVRAEYDETVARAEQSELEEALELARDYNRQLLEGSVFLTDPFDPDLQLDPTVEPYADLLNLEGDGMMGYVEVPKIDVYLPIYHGTTGEVLEKGVGHLQNTSLPVGGESSHAVLTGHTGLSGKRLFTDLTEVEVGDVFYLHILGQTLAYQVDRIDIVEPDDTELLQVETGEDLVTLVTCYPYGVNTQRLLVRGIRIPYEEAVEQQALQGTMDQGDSVWVQQYRKAILVCVAVYMPLTVVILLLLLRRRKKRERQKQTP